MEARSALRTAVSTHLHSLWAPRTTRIACGLLLVLVLGIVVLWALGGLSSATLISLRSGLIVLGMPVAAALISELALRDGLTTRTLLYPLLGPVSRELLAVVRTAMVMVVVLVGFLALTLLLTALGAGSFSTGLLLAIAAGSATYTALFGLLHILTRRGLVTGLAIFFLVDYQVARVPFGLRNVAPSTHVHALASATNVESFGLPLAVSHPSLAMSLTVLGIYTVLCLALTVHRFARLDLGEIC